MRIRLTRRREYGSVLSASSGNLIIVLLAVYIRAKIKCSSETWETFVHNPVLPVLSGGLNAPPDVQLEYPVNIDSKRHGIHIFRTTKIDTMPNWQHNQPHPLELSIWFFPTPIDLSVQATEYVVPPIIAAKLFHGLAIAVLGNPLPTPPILHPSIKASLY